LEGRRCYVSGDSAAAAELIRAEGGFPSLPLKKTADAYYFQGMYRSAIATLDKLAEEAAQVGDIVTQAWVQADAVWLFDMDCRQHLKSERPGRNLEMSQRATNLRLVLGSPFGRSGATPPEPRSPGGSAVELCRAR
jgi:hypothetical protein